MIDERPDFDPRQWREQLPTMDALGALLFQVGGQQLSESSKRASLGRMEALFGGRLPASEELLDEDPETRRGAGLSRRKVETEQELLTIAERWRLYRSLAAGDLFLSDLEPTTP
jgi:3-methyladenine DNA glycosylase/8-oxoguanine DNA glycosylase